MSARDPQIDHVTITIDAYNFDVGRQKVQFALPLTDETRAVILQWWREEDQRRLVALRTQTNDPFAIG